MLLGIDQTPLVGHEEGLFREKDAGFAGRTKSCVHAVLGLANRHILSATLVTGQEVSEDMKTFVTYHFTQP